MAEKCVHKGCGKLFTDPDEPCHYHSGPPEFHEGQKGWKCCKPRVLTFDEFMNIPPCTTGKHSTVDDTPVPAPPKPTDEEIEAKIREQQEKAAAALPPAVARVAISAQPTPRSSSPAPPPEDEEDDPTIPIPPNATCRRRGCDATYTGDGTSRSSSETCIHHPGQALFHEGSKGWTCCKKRVLEFDEFMRIPGCKTSSRHCFVGQKKKDTAHEEELKDVRNDFYQTATSVIASLYLKKIDKARSRVEFGEDGRTVELDLHTADQKHYSNAVDLYGKIKPTESSFKILGTKLELTLAKADSAGWPVLRASDPHTGEIIQAGRAGRA